MRVGPSTVQPLKIFDNLDIDISIEFPGGESMSQKARHFLRESNFRGLDRRAVPRSEERDLPGWLTRKLGRYSVAHKFTIDGHRVWGISDRDRGYREIVLYGQNGRALAGGYAEGRNMDTDRLKLFDVSNR